MSDTNQQALNIASECFAVRLRKLNRIVSSLYDESLRPFGITIAQFNLLVAIGARGQSSPSQLVNSLSLEKSTVSRNIEKMRRKEWICFISAEDKRSHLLALTPVGKRLLKKTTPAWRSAQEKAEETLGPLSSMIKSVPIS